MKILNYRKQPPGNYAVAIFDIYLEALDVTWCNFKLIQSKKGHRFVSPPQFSVQDIEGKKIWKPLIWFGEERGKQFNQKCLELLLEFDLSPTPHTTADSVFH